MRNCREHLCKCTRELRKRFPKERAAITLKDLIDCKVGETVVGILTDVFAFLQYDQREQLMHSADPE